MSLIRSTLKGRPKALFSYQRSIERGASIHFASTNALVTQPGTIPAHLPIVRQVPPNEGRKGNPGFFTPSHIREDRSPSSPEKGEINDHEFEVRIGRAFDLLRATLPDFMRIGLVDYDQYSSASSNDNSSSSFSSMSLLDALTFRSLRAKAAEEGLLGGSFGNNRKDDQQSIFPQNHPTPKDEQIYHSNIHFRFSPTGSEAETNLTEEEEASLSFSGRSLYFASAHVLRHTLNILFSNTQVNVESIRRERKQKENVEPEVTMGLHSCHSRQETIYARIGFSGNLRVTGAEHRYTVLFRYEFDPKTGRIINHFVEKIEPAIGRKLWYGLASVWQKITGQQSHPHPIPTHISAHCGSHNSHNE